MSDPLVQANRRRAVLSATGCATYQIQMRNGHDAIICMCCGIASYNPNDVANRYCGFCHEFHSEWNPPLPKEQ